MECFRIGVDMDDVIVDTHSAILAWAERTYDAAFLHRTSEPLHELITGERSVQLRAMLDEGSIFRHLKPKSRAIEVLKVLAANHQVFIVTAAMEHPASMTPKFEWLREHLPFLPPSRYVFCGDKSVIGVDYLIDDTPAQLEALRGEGILFDAPKNRNEKCFRRVRNWDEVQALFE